MKEDLKSILTAFRLQTETSDHSTNHYPPFYHGLELKVGFGIGRDAQIPWIAFLGKNQTPQEGIFPVLYFFKAYHKLVLAYGVSETREPRREWLFTLKPKTVVEYFRGQGLSPHKYHLSYVHSVYSTIKELDWNKLQTDLDDVINRYKKTVPAF